MAEARQTTPEKKAKGGADTGTPTKWTVEGQLKISKRKREYGIEVDFKHGTISLTKDQGSKSHLKQFTLSSVVGMEKLDGNIGSRLRLVIQSGGSEDYVKELRFKSSMERDDFCQLIHQGIEMGHVAGDADSLDSSSNSTDTSPTSFVTTASPSMKGFRRNKYAILTAERNGVLPLMPGELVHFFASHTSRLDIPGVPVPMSLNGQQSQTPLPTPSSSHRRTFLGSKKPQFVFPTKSHTDEV
jgi:hypothetical protein